MGHTNLSTSATTVDTVHPHIRGAYCNPLSANGLRCGSSPPTWGILDLHAAHAGERRFIPTYVGHTRAVNPVNIYCPVHPHIRGVYADCVPITVSVGGSSPPTWGIPGRGSRLLANVRFIPTYVGHIALWGGPQPPPAVHPHIRGAYIGCPQITQILGGSSPHTWGIRGRSWPVPGPAGSSPHTWGIRLTIRAHFVEHRFIPTYVGHTVVPGSMPPVSTGSSPHTWGIPVVVAPGIHKDRFIPTYVGHTLPLLPGSTPPSVHPHIRGAYRFDTGNTAQSPGSSPHTWGIHSIWQITAGPIWFIPTYVGHTHGPGQPFRPRLVHPHIRGAYIRLFRGKLIFNGSSPHTWGIRRK